MKKIIIFVSIIALLFASCKSTPVEEPVEPVEVVEVVEEVPETQPEEKPAEVVEKPVEVDFTRENEASIAKLLYSRKLAIESGASELLPEQFDEAENIFNSRKDEVEKNIKSVSFSAEIDDLNLRYQALANAATAYSAKLKVDEYGFSEYDKKNYEAGEKFYNQTIDLYTSDADNKSLVESTKNAKDAYSKVLVIGFKKVATTARTDAVNAKKKADSVYAGVAEKEKYKSCADKIIKSDSDLVTGNLEGAFKGYKDATTSFIALYESVSKKRAEAQAKIDKAREAVEKSKAYAEQADEIAPLTESVAGIEEEDATLLEQDAYVDPASAEIDVNSTEKGKAAAALESVIQMGGEE